MAGFGGYPSGCYAIRDVAPYPVNIALSSVYESSFSAKREWTTNCDTKGKVAP